MRFGSVIKKVGIQKGFTLIELIVSLGLFSVVMTISAGAVLSILDANAKAQSASAIMTNLNIALDGMTREMRTGTGFSCTNDYTFSFTTQDGADVIYTRNSGSGSVLPSITKAVDGAAAVPITSPEISVDTLKFSCVGTSGSDLIQPFVRIIIRGNAGTKTNLITYFDIQTSVTQRLLDASGSAEPTPSFGE